MRFPKDLRSSRPVDKRCAVGRASMAQQRFVSIGECMIEMSGGEDRQYRLGYAGDTLNTAWYMRALLGKDWSVDYFTGLGEDRYSGDIRAFLDANNIGTSHIRT